jgi:8-oxo-dGTP diphosphatase
MFVTVTQTVRSLGQHTDVSLWFVLSGGMRQPLAPDPGEFHEARWWTRDQIERASPGSSTPI